MTSVKRSIDSVIIELKAMADVGVIDDGLLKKARSYVDNHEDEVKEALLRLSISDAADEVVELARSRGAGNPVGYGRDDRSTTEGESEMAAKKGKKSKGKAKGKTVARRATGEAQPRATVANFVRAELVKSGKDYDAQKIAEKAAEKFPGRKPTAGYVNWISQHAPEVSTTTTVPA